MAARPSVVAVKVRLIVRIVRGRVESVEAGRASPISTANRVLRPAACTCASPEMDNPHAKHSKAVGSFVKLWRITSSPTRGSLVRTTSPVSQPSVSQAGQSRSCRPSLARTRSSRVSTRTCLQRRRPAGSAPAWERRSELAPLRRLHLAPPPSDRGLTVRARCERGSEAGGSGIEGGAVRTDQARPRPRGAVDPGAGGASWRASARGAPGVGLAVAAGQAHADVEAGAEARCLSGADRRVA